MLLLQSHFVDAGFREQGTGEKNIKMLVKPLLWVHACIRILNTLAISALNAFYKNFQNEFLVSRILTL